MNIKTLFEPPQLTEKEKSNYLHKELNKKMEELIEKGLEGIEYKNEVFKVKEMLKREIKNGILRVYVKPNIHHKRILHNHLLENNLLHLLNIADNIEYHLPKAIKTHKDFTNHISKKNLFSIIFPELKRFDDGGRQPCIFKNENVGWITKDNQGYFRYCSKNKRSGVILGFSLLDIIEVAYEDYIVSKEISYQNARNRVAILLGAKYNEFEFELQQREKYINNLSIIHNMTQIKQEFPHLHSLIKSQVYVLTKLHTFAMDNIMEKCHAIKKEAVFFVSTKTLKEDLEYNHNIVREQSTIASAINLFATLGLLNKMPSNTIKKNETLYRIALNIQGDQIKHRFINFMTIPKYDYELLSKAEKIAKRLKKNNITTAKQITRKTLINLFGINKANQIIEANSLMSMSEDELFNMADSALKDKG